MNKTILCFFTACIILLSGCSLFQTETPMVKEDAKKAALACFEEHKADMEAIVQSGKATGEPKCCQVYNLLSNGKYEFILQQTGFTGINTKTGLLYIPNDTPDPAYTQDESNPDFYFYNAGHTDCYFLERISQNWFFFYSKYDF